MKIIPLRDDGAFTTVSIIKEAAGAAAGGMNVAQMRSRIRILDAADGVKGNELLLEDADHATLKDAINATAWSVAHPKLLAILDDILEAKAKVEKPELP